MEVRLVETYFANGRKLEYFFRSWDEVRNILEARAIVCGTEGCDYNDLSLIGSIFCKVNDLKIEKLVN